MKAFLETVVIIYVVIIYYSSNTVSNRWWPTRDAYNIETGYVSEERYIHLLVRTGGVGKEENNNSYSTRKPKKLSVRKCDPGSNIDLNSKKKPGIPAPLTSHLRRG